MQSSAPLGAASPDNSASDALIRARGLLSSSDNLEAGPKTWDRTRAEFDRLGLHGDFFSVYGALKKALAEVKPENMHLRKDPAYDGACEGSPLWEMRWQSTYFGREMYLKFALTDETVVLYSVHESTIVHIEEKKGGKS